MIKMLSTATLAFTAAGLISLAPLKLDKARFRVAIEPLAEERAGATGMDRVEFEISTLPGAAFDDSVKLQVAQPRDQYRARYQRYAAMEIVEGADIGHQLAQDQRHPALGENFRRLRDRAELVIPAVHAGH